VIFCVNKDDLVEKDLKKRFIDFELFLSKLKPLILSVLSESKNVMILTIEIFQIHIRKDCINDAAIFVERRFALTDYNIIKNRNRNMRI